MLSFAFSPEQEDFRTQLRRFAVAELAPTTSSAPRARSSAGTRIGSWPSSASSASAFPRSTAGPGHPTR